MTGAAVGAITAGIQWQAIQHGLCGDRDLPFGVDQFMEVAVTIGAVFGGIVGGLPPSLAMVVMTAASGAGLLAAGLDIAVNGLNACNLINLIMSFIGVGGSTSQVTLPWMGVSITLQGNALAGQMVTSVTIPNVAAGSLGLQGLMFSEATGDGNGGGDDSDDSNDGSNPPPDVQENLRERMLDAVIQEFKNWRDFEYSAEAWEEFIDFEGPKKVANPDPRLSIPSHQQQRYQVAVNDMFEGRVEISVNYDPINDIFGTIKRASGR